MKPHLVSGLAVVLGLAAGALAQRALHPPVEPVAPPAPAKTVQRPQVIEPGLLPSSDTLETLKDPDLPDRVARLAIWLPHASQPELSALWDDLVAHKPIPYPMAALVFSRWVVLDPQGAMEANRKLGADSGAWEAWAAVDPQAAEAAARASGQAGALAMVLKGIAGRDPDYVAKLIEQDYKGLGRLLTNVVDGFIAQRRYDKALDVAMRLGIDGHNDSRDKILREWAREDIGEMLAWGARNPKILRSLGEDIPEEILRGQVDKIPGILAKMPSGQAKGKVREAYTMALAEKDPAAAIHFAEGVEAPLAGAALLGSLGRKFTTTQPAAAVEVLGKLLDSGRALDEYPVAVFFLEGQRDGWHSTDTPFPGFAEDLVNHMPEMALDAVMASADKPAYQAAARQLAGAWMEKDEWDFSGWLKRQPAGKMRDELAISYSTQLVNGDKPAYEPALQWASGVADAGQRDHQLDRVLEEWKDANAEALQAYLRASTTPEIIRSRGKKLNDDR